MTADRQQIAEIVRKHIQQQPPLDGITLAVLDDEVRAENKWWYVPVLPSRQPERVSPYYDLLATVEEEILRDEDLDVFLIPTLPGK
jgi:hypothetical protein